jgi:hypothetical protein
MKKTEGRKSRDTAPLMCMPLPIDVMAVSKNIVYIFRVLTHKNQANLNVNITQVTVAFYAARNHSRVDRYLSLQFRFLIGTGTVACKMFKII